MISGFHTPSSAEEAIELRASLGSGMPPIMEIIAAGIPVAISTDGSGSAENAARPAAQYQKAPHRDATLLPAQQLMEKITVPSSAILGLNRGEPTPGRQADWGPVGTLYLPTRDGSGVERNRRPSVNGRGIPFF